MMNPSLIQPDAELRDYLAESIGISVQTPDGVKQPITIYRDWERPTNTLPTDFIVIYINGEVEGVGVDTEFAKGYLMVSLYSKMNDDGSVKINRIQNILSQFDDIFDHLVTEHYHYEYDVDRFITPTSPNQTSGYSVTTLNLKWHTTNNFIKTS